MARTSPHRNASLFSLLCLTLLAACSPADPRADAAPESTTAAQAQVEETLQPLPSPTQAVKATPVLTAAPTLTDSPTAAATLASTPAPLPVEHFITNIRGHKQYFSLGCEAAVAKDWANYFGYDFNEFEFQYKLPLSDNPELGFVGDVNAPWGQVPPYGYGVHAGPVADLLNAYGIPAKAYKNYSLEQVLAELAADQPVIAWVIGNVVGGVPYEYTDKQGSKVTVAAYEHVIVLTGYSEKNIRYMTNGKFFDTPKEVFLNSWGVLGNMVIVQGD